MDLISVGVGGSTLDELKENLTGHELSQWIQKQQRDGPINLGVRIDRGFALIAYMIYGALPGKGPKKTMADFMPPWYHKPKAELREPTMDEVMAALGGK